VCPNSGNLKAWKWSSLWMECSVENVTVTSVTVTIVTVTSVTVTVRHVGVWNGYLLWVFVLKLCRVPGSLVHISTCRGMWNANQIYTSAVHTLKCSVHKLIFGSPAGRGA
jgi:hypothetical protein